MTITADLIRELIDYDPDAGTFTWRERSRRFFKNDQQYKTWNSLFCGKAAGSVNKHKGYLMITLFYRHYASHRLAWLYVTGEWPSNVIDHIDHDRLNNRFSNLRDIDRTQNSQNMSRQSKRSNQTMGVLWRKNRQVWIAKIVVQKKEIYLGTFKTQEEAAAVRREANERYGFHTNHGEMIAPVRKRFGRDRRAQGTRS